MWTRSPRSSSRRAGARVLAWWLAATVGLSVPVRQGAAGGSAVTPPGVTWQDSTLARAHKILRDHRYQTRLPDAVADPGWHFRLPSFVIRPWFVALGVIALIAGIVTWWIPKLRRDDEDVTGREGEAAIPASGDAREGMAYAERLAAQGRYSEAGHHLLLVAIDSLTRSAATAPRSSHTSREILRTLPGQVPEARRSALAELVRLVEVSWFGGHPFAEREFTSCLLCCRTIVGSTP